MTTTTRLGITLIAPTQSNKSTTANDATQALEDATQGTLAVSVASASQTLTDPQFTGAWLFAVSGAATAGRTVTVPNDIERIFAASLDSGSAESVDLVCGSNDVTLDPGMAAIVRTDGAGGIAMVMQGSTAAGPTEAEPKAETLIVAVGDETTALTTGAAKVTFRMPWAMTLTAVRASLTTASSSGNPTVDINEAGASILSTKLTIDSGETTSTTAATAAVISDTALADDAEITIDVDTAGTGAAGLKVTLIGTRA